MSRKLTSATTLDHLKKEAKRWLKALRENDVAARDRFARAYPKAAGAPVLRDVQHALACEYGFADWKELKDAIGVAAPPPQPAEGDVVAQFLEYACPDHHVRSRPAHRMAAHAAMRLLDERPEIAHADIYTAAVCGEIDEVRRLLAERPELANERRAASGPARSGGGGSYDFLGELGGKDWTPLLFLCFTRLPLERANENAVAIARLLLDAGADPNASFMAGASTYTPLTGVAGEGEEDRPPHPRRDELARLLLERGAEPYDQQVIYDLHFHGKVLWWLKLMHEFSVRAGRAADWANPEWHMIDCGPYGSGARWHLRIAVQRNDLELAEWCLAHGATPNAGPEEGKNFDKRSLWEQAVRLGHLEMAELLAHDGAETRELVLDDEEAYVAAALRLDGTELERLLASHPEFRESTRAIFRAAREDRVDTVALLLDFGTPVEVRDEKEQRPLHAAARENAVRVAELLIARGAEIDPYELSYNNTPLDFAVYADHREMIEVLAPHSRDVWNLVRMGRVERLREVIAAEPRLAKVTWQTTPLFWLPDDERQAVEIVRLFLEHGADAKFRSQKDGTTAADVARRRGLRQAAALLDAAAGVEADPEAARRAHVIGVYEQLARDLVAANGIDGEGALEDARETIAKRSGYASWRALLHTGVAEDFVKAYDGDATALERLNAHYKRTFRHADLKAEIWRRVYAFRQRSSKVEKNFLKLDEAQTVVAQDAGFSSWEALVSGARPVPAFEIQDARIAPRRRLTDREWDELIEAAKEHRIAALDAGGLMTDRAMARVAELERVTSLNLSGSRELSDDGLLQLARMPQLEHLALNEYPGGKLTDRGLAVLRQLPNLRTFEMTWQAGITDAGVANLRFCEKLERVDLMGSPTGDGAIEALAEKPLLHAFSSGRLVTDRGLAGLRAFPLLRTLLIDGPFTDAGLAELAGLEGLAELDLFWHVSAMTAAGFAHLARLPNLLSLACDGKLSDDAAMAHIATMPRLRSLRAQESVASDEGFVALARSKTLEGFWGRECPGFGDRGFAAFSRMPALRKLGVGLGKVSEGVVARLADFPALRELTPIGLRDDGFRHVGRCAQLERLTCMYCRESGDAATEHIARLPLKYYYAGLTQITDRSLEILGGMESLEQVDLYECKGVTDAGLPFLAKLPQLREAHFDGLPGVTLDGTKVFGPDVKVSYTT
jgi:ankyrin repeat protein